MSHITPFSKDEPLIKVDVQIKGAKGTEIFLVFAFDTGATNTIISWEAAYRLGYDPALSSNRKRIITGSSIEYAPIITVDSLTAIGTKADKLEVLCHDIPEESGIDGLLGLNFMRTIDFCIKYSMGIIEIT